MSKPAACPVRETVKQCKTCPWRADADPYAIPNGYSVAKHRALKDTIAEPGAVRFGGPMRVMACHYSGAPGTETPCAGWLANQIGPGNNIAARMAVMTGRMPAPIVDGEQHETFEATLPKRRRRRKDAP